eukprot:10178515-Alexandrium_andersonii.AAC.1
MSASLVGSEMCIRDRPRSAPASETALRWCWRGLSEASSLGPAAQVEAVSYTHLTLPTICSV